jgi:hypothetical protein
VGFRHNGYAEIEKVLEALAFMGTVDASNVVVELSAEGVVDVGVVALFVVVPKGGGHFLERGSFFMFVELFVVGPAGDSVDVFVDAVQEFLHEFVRVFLFPVHE